MKLLQEITFLEDENLGSFKKSLFSSSSSSSSSSLSLSLSLSLWFREADERVMASRVHYKPLNKPLDAFVLNWPYLIRVQTVTIRTIFRLFGRLNT
jgi:hypothetical protein